MRELQFAPNQALHVTSSYIDHILTCSWVWIHVIGRRVYFWHMFISATTYTLAYMYVYLGNSVHTQSMVDEAKVQGSFPNLLHIWEKSE